MASIATGSIVADISGKVGDNIYSRNRAGPYVKAYAAPVQPNTTKQLLRQAMFSLSVVTWNELSDADHLAWVAFSLQYQKSSFNSSKVKVEPRAFFIGCAMNILVAGGSFPPSPVMPDNMGFTHIDVSIPDATHLEVIWRGGVSDPNYDLTYYSTFAHPLAVRSINSVQQVFFGRFSYLADTTFQLFTGWNTNFPSGFPTSEQRIFISTKITHFLSGIQVGFGWASVIGPGGGSPFNVGNEDIRTSQSTFKNRRATQITAPANGDINSLSCYLHVNGGNILVGIYADAAGSPGARLGISVSTVATAAPGFQLIPLISSVAITSGTKYWLALVGNGTLKIGFDATPITYSDGPGSSFDLPDPFGSSTPSVNGMSLFGSATP